MPRIAAIRSFVMNHSIHHRGQLSVYLRLNDVPIPPIYGPTADEPVSNETAVRNGALTGRRSAFWPRAFSRSSSWRRSTRRDIGTARPTRRSTRQPS